MGRRNGSMLTLLVQSPWWVGVVISGLVFVFLKAILPGIDFGSLTTIRSFGRGISGATPFIALVLLIPAPIAALNA